MSAEATCTGALKALHRAGVVSPRDRAWLEPALRETVGLPGRWEVPWAAWTLRICEHMGADAGNPRAAPGAPHDPWSSAAAGSLAIVITTLTAGSLAAVDAPDLIARWSLAGRVLDQMLGAAQGGVSTSNSARDSSRRSGGAPLADRIAPWLLGLGEHPAAAAPRNPAVPCGADDERAGSGGLDDFSSLPGQTPLGRARLTSGLWPGAAPGVRDVVALWSAPALIIGDDLAPWTRFGVAVAEPIGLLHALVRLWLDPGAGDLRDAAFTPLVALWLSEPSLRGPLLAAYAGERESPVRRFAIHSLLASAAFREALSRRAAHLIVSARAALTGPRLFVVVADFLDALEERFRFFDALMAFRALVKSSEGQAMRQELSIGSTDLPLESVRAPLEEAELDLRMANAFLRESAPWSGSWEVQRAGVFGSKEQPVGQWFARGTILQVLLEMGHDVRVDIAALLDEIPAGELRYFGSWRGIPPDADDLGLMLQLASATGAVDRAETWIAVMLANVKDDGIVPTWFHRDPAGRPTTSSGREWGGDDCSAVRLSLLAGLLSFDARRFELLIQKNTERILERASSGALEGTFYYDDAFASLAFLRFARLHRERAIDRSLSGAIGSVEAAIRARAAASQRLDGGWGSPQRTAMYLEGAAMAAAHPLLLGRGMRYLGEHQLVDGSWPAEPFFRTPLKWGRTGHHQGREISTALCARSLSAAADVLSRSGGPRPGLGWGGGILP